MINQINDIDIPASEVEVELINTFIKLFGEENIEIYDRESVGVITNNTKRVKTHIISFRLFGEVDFKAYINNDIKSKELLDIKIKNEYSRACNLLKDLLLRLDRYFVNEIM